jgi:hypothetical protein
MGRRFSPGASVSSTNKADRHDIAEILLKVVLNLTLNPRTVTIIKFILSLQVCHIGNARKDYQR